MQRKCPECKKLKLRRLFGTGAAVMFKGSGFYQTDYRSDAYKKAASADAPKDEGSSSKSSDGSAAPSKTDNTTKKDTSSSSEKPAGKSKSSEK